MRRLGTEEGSGYYLGSDPKLEVDPVPLEMAEWQLQVGCWRPRPVKWKISRHRGGQEDKRVGSEMASLRQPAEGPPLCHPVDERRLATKGGCTLAAHLRAAGAMFVGIALGPIPNYG